jgi:hypothetical protein
VWARVIVKKHNFRTKHAAPFVLYCGPQLVQVFTIRCCVDCCASWEEFNQEKIPCLSQSKVHMIFLVDIVCLVADFYEQGVQNVKPCYDKCLSVGGDYVEKQTKVCRT